MYCTEQLDHEDGVMAAAEFCMRSIKYPEDQAELMTAGSAWDTR
jgi:hypothetical protein